MTISAVCLEVVVCARIRRQTVLSVGVLLVVLPMRMLMTLTNLYAKTRMHTRARAHTYTRTHKPGQHRWGCPKLFLSKCPAFGRSGTFWWLHWEASCNTYDNLSYLRALFAFRKPILIRHTLTQAILISAVLN